MIARCEDPGHVAYTNYGARGITVCPEWHDVRIYIRYVEDVLGAAPDPTFSIDRIDNDGNYEPGNLRWATKSEQIKNRRHSTRTAAA